MDDLLGDDRDTKQFNLAADANNAAAATAESTSDDIKSGDGGDETLERRCRSELLVTISGSPKFVILAMGNFENREF